MKMNLKSENFIGKLNTLIGFLVSLGFSEVKEKSEKHANQTRYNVKNENRKESIKTSGMQVVIFKSALFGVIAVSLSDDRQLARSIWCGFLVCGCFVPVVKIAAPQDKDYSTLSSYSLESLETALINAASLKDELMEVINRKEYSVQSLLDQVIDYRNDRDKFGNSPVSHLNYIGKDNQAGFAAFLSVIKGFAFGTDVLKDSGKRFRGLRQIRFHFELSDYLLDRMLAE